MTRHIVQIAVGTASAPESGAEYSERLYALDNDGRVWRIDDADVKNSLSPSGVWMPLPLLPGPEVVR